MEICSSASVITKCADPPREGQRDLRQADMSALEGEYRTRRLVLEAWDKLEG
jgi:hypothetical protein